MSRINQNLKSILKKTHTVKEDFEKYRYLWEEHPEENFTKFLEENIAKIETQEG